MSRQIMTPERIAEFRDAIANHPHFGIGGDALSKILDALESAQAEIAHVRGIMEAGEKECRHREEQDRVYRTKITILENQIADLKRGGVVVPDDEFTLDLDTQKGSDPCITINSKKNGVGYELVSGSIDGHFSRRTYNITPYMRHCLDTIGIHPIPADRVLREGEVKISREDAALAVEWCHAVQDLNPGYLEERDRAACKRFEALRAQPTQELAP